MLIIWRLAGTARKTPSDAMTISQMAMYQWFAGSAPGFSIIKAGIALTSPAAEIDPAAVAQDCIALFSRMLNGGNQRGTSRCSVAKMLYASTHEVTATPRLQPAFKPT